MLFHEETFVRSRTLLHAASAAGHAAPTDQHSRHNFSFKHSGHCSYRLNRCMCALDGSRTHGVTTGNASPPTSTASLRQTWNLESEAQGDLEALMVLWRSTAPGCSNTRGATAAGTAPEAHADTHPNTACDYSQTSKTYPSNRVCAQWSPTQTQAHRSNICGQPIALPDLHAQQHTQHHMHQRLPNNRNMDQDHIRAKLARKARQRHSHSGTATPGHRHLLNPATHRPSLKDPPWIPSKQRRIQSSVTQPQPAAVKGTNNSAHAWTSSTTGPEPLQRDATDDTHARGRPDTANMNSSYISTAA